MNAGTPGLMSGHSAARLIAHLHMEEDALRRADHVLGEVTGSSWAAASRGRLEELLARLAVCAQDAADSRREMVVDLSLELGWDAAEVTLSRLTGCCPAEQLPKLHEAARRLRGAAHRVGEAVRRLGYMVVEWQGLYESVLQTLCASSTSDRYGATGRRCLPSGLPMSDITG